MSNQSFGRTVQKLAEESGYDNFIVTAVDSETGEGATVIGGNNKQLISIMALGTLQDIVERFGVETLLEGLDSFSKETEEVDLDSADEEIKQEILNTLKEIKRKLGM